MQARFLALRMQLLLVGRLLHFCNSLYGLTHAKVDVLTTCVKQPFCILQMPLRLIIVKLAALELEI